MPGAAAPDHGTARAAGHDSDRVGAMTVGSGAQREGEEEARGWEGGAGIAWHARDEEMASPSSSDVKPKKSSPRGKAQKKKELVRNPTADWTPSKCSNADLIGLYNAGVPQSNDLVQWHLAKGHSFPQENVDEIVSSYHFYERGLALPATNFFRGMLYHYGLELHHLTPNGIVHVAIFIYLCEAFLGIEPYWDLFRYVFRIKLQPKHNAPLVVGGAGIQLKKNLGDKYIEYEFSSNISRWRDMWFYIGNHAPSLPDNFGSPPA
ncbi:orf3 [Panicum miliaceum]|uniref:Orf3 n=1 Tax=Panicum miliaceum TaxID=4540 RepID=A0A3L6SU57_PANMI|nr:orf3 [Panicum miliaceum]